MVELKRDAIKYIRDKAKSRYTKDKECYICRSEKSIELHHYNTLTLLMAKWIKQENLYQDNVLEWREEFIREHEQELYGDTVTLCTHCHNGKLHKLYGKKPPLITAKKQQHWVEKQRAKWDS